VHIALLHLVIDPACTVVFEAMAGGPELLHKPPRPPESPLLSAGDGWRALGQGSALLGAVLLLAFWPELPLESRRSLVFALLLLAGGGLVWLNGQRGSPLRLAGPVLALGIWILIQGVAPVRRLLELGPLAPPQLALLALALGVALLGAQTLEWLRTWPRQAGRIGPHP
jgi:Ca2+-transporting ATPase